MSCPFFSVIIPVRDGARTLEALGARLWAQSAADQAEFIFVDDASADETPAVIGRLLAQAAERGLDARRLRLETSGGSYAARNAGLRAARGQVFVFTDADCRPDPEWLRAYASAFEDASVGLAAGRIEPESGDTLCERYARERGILNQTGPLSKSRPWAQTANLAARREVFRRVGFFRRLESGGDADFCLRAGDAGWSPVYVPGALVYHQHRRSLGGLYRQYRRYGRGRKILSMLYADTEEVRESLPPFPGWDHVLRKARERFGQAARGRGSWGRAIFFLLCDAVACWGAALGGVGARLNDDIQRIDPWTEPAREASGPATDG